MKISRKVAKTIDMLATMPTTPIRFKWDKASKVPKNVKRKIRYQYNKLNKDNKIENKIFEAYRDKMIYGSNEII